MRQITQSEIDAHNKRAIKDTLVRIHNEKAIAFFNNQKVETSTKSGRWNR